MDTTPILPGTPLTPREQAVLTLVSKGHSNLEVAYHLNISRPTVNSYLKIIFSKLGVDNRVRAARWAWEQGLA